MDDNSTPVNDNSTTQVDGVSGAPDDSAQQQESAPDMDKDWKAEAEKWRSLSRKHEDNWKKLSKEIEELRKAQMSEQERALLEAEERGRRAALESIAHERAQLKLEAAAAKAGVDLSPIAEMLNVSRFIEEDGSVSEDRITGFVEQLASKFAQPKGPKYPQGLGIGPQSSSSKPPQLTRADLRRMTPQQIVEADEKGLLEDIKRGLI